MSGSADDQVELVKLLAAWEHAEFAARLFPEHREQQHKADQLHIELCKVCLSCGYEPGRQHMHLSLLEFARERAALIQRVLPIHLNQDRKAA